MEGCSLNSAWMSRTWFMDVLYTPTKSSSTPRSITYNLYITTEFDRVETLEVRRCYEMLLSLWSL